MIFCLAPEVSLLLISKQFHLSVSRNATFLSQTKTGTGYGDNQDQEELETTELFVAENLACV